MATQVNQGLRIAKVVPLIRTGPVISIFDYAIPHGVSVVPGEHVTISFRQKSITGIVWSITTKPVKSTRALKELTPCIPRSALTSEQIALASWLHRETLTRLSNILRMAVPTLLRTQRNRSSRCAEISGVLWHTLDQHDEAVDAFVKKVRREKSRTLIIVPTHALVEFWKTKLEADAPVVLEGPVQSATYRKCVAQLSTARFIICTQSGVLAPFPEIQRIFVDWADDAGYAAFDQAPRFDIRSFIRWFAAEHRAQLVFFARWATPWLLNVVPEKRWTVLPDRTTLTFIDRANDPLRERMDIITPTLARAVQHSRTLWLLQRRGAAGVVICRDCGAPVVCPTCGAPARVVRIGNVEQMECTRDRIRFSMPETCATCASVRLSSRSPGVETVADSLAKIFPGQRICSVDREHIYGKLETAQHIVATSAIANDLTFRCDVCVIVQADALLKSGQYLAEEEFVDLVSLAKQFLRGYQQVYIQTFQPQHRALTGLLNLEKLSKTILAERIALNYPPGGTLIVCQPISRASR